MFHVFGAIAQFERALMKEGKLPVRDVAKRMGVSVATLYRHVGKRGADDDAADAAAARG
ncbi:MAG: helix-turn-helix domain-containing protein [Bradyrhizobium sp.]